MGIGLKPLGLNTAADVKANFLSKPIRNRARSVLDPKTFGVKRASEFAHVLRVAMKRRKVEFSSHTANLALLRQCVRDFLNGYPFSEKQRLLIVLGVDEACTNVIRHAYRLRDDQLISLRMEKLRQHYPWLAGGLDYFQVRLTQAPEDAQFAVAFVHENAKNRAEQELAIQALRDKCDILWAQLDALYFAYVEPGWPPPGAFRIEGDSA